MAIVDFSNAHIQPYTDNPAKYDGIGLNLDSTSNFVDSNGNSVVSSISRRQQIDAQNELKNVYSGTFSANGTEFYLAFRDGLGWIRTCWRIYNISFASGDTFTFSIDAALDT